MSQFDNPQQSIVTVLGRQLPQPYSGLNYYLPERYFIHQFEPDRFVKCMYVLASNLAKLADTFYITNLMTGEKLIEGSVTSEISDDYKRILDSSEEPIMIAINLFRNGHIILDQSDGPLGVICVSDAELSYLESSLREANFPANLFYPHSMHITVEEAIELHGGVVNMIKEYTPMEFRSKHDDNTERLRAPEERESSGRFVEAARIFHEELQLRMIYIVHQGGARTRSNELHALANIAAELRSYIISGSSSPGSDAIATDS